MLYDRFSNATKTLGAGEGISDPRDRRQVHIVPTAAGRRLENG